MSDETPAGEYPSFDTIDDEISDDQATLLATIHDADGGVRPAGCGRRRRFPTGA